MDQEGHAAEIYSSKAKPRDGQRNEAESNRTATRSSQK